MGVKFVTPKEGDAVAVVARRSRRRSRRGPETGDDGTTTPAPEDGADLPAETVAESPDHGSGATIEETPGNRLADSPPESEA